MKLKVLVTREIFEDILDYLAGHFEVSANQSDIPMDPQTLAKNLTNKSGVMTTLMDRVDAALLSACPTLKAVCNIAVGFNNIDLNACSRAKIMVTNTPGVLDDSTADFTWALIMATARRVVESDTHLRSGHWKGWYLKQFLGADVHHATLGILGFGRIGRKVARRASGFDMTVLYHSTRQADPDVERACNATYVSKDALLTRADILTIHVPYAPSTHHIIGRPELAMMKPGAILINAARGGVVDDAALVEALTSGRIAGAGLDVFENEPALNPALITMKNVVLTPHIASSSAATRHAMAMLAARNLVAALTTGKPPNLINPEPSGDGSGQ
ncbi:MAG: D-glycerate dehydrogenase [Desulfobacteraceae bacterium]|nr:MAG: D-glycerate dehydrogenase [Desulfobacteraceae bacterium]